MMIKKNTALLTLAFVISFLSNSCSSSSSDKSELNQSNESPQKEKIEISIGNQVWMIKNLNVSTFRNGDPIPQVKSDEEWKKNINSKQPAWCYYENDSLNGTKYGKLYNFYAVNDARGIAPLGWHVPSADEWNSLATYLGGRESAGKKLKASSEWKDQKNGNNESGFSGLPGGARNSLGPFYGIGETAAWWSSTTLNESNPEARCQKVTTSYGDLILESIDYKQAGYSVRCIKD